MRASGSGVNRANVGSLRDARLLPEHLARVPAFSPRNDQVRKVSSLFQFDRRPLRPHKVKVAQATSCPRPCVSPPWQTAPSPVLGTDGGAVQSLLSPCAQGRAPKPAGGVVPARALITTALGGRCPRRRPKVPGGWALEQPSVQPHHRRGGLSPSTQNSAQQP